MKNRLLIGGAMVAVAAAIMSSDAEPVEATLGAGPCSMGWKLMNYQSRPYHSFGEVDGYNAQQEVVRDNSHWAAYSGFITVPTSHHPTCDDDEDPNPV